MEQISDPISGSAAFLNWTMTNEELDKQYRALCKQLHPDVNLRRNTKDTTAEFQELNALYEKIKKYRSEPLCIDLSVSLSEIYHGCIKDIVLENPTCADRKTVLPVYIPMGTMDETVITLTSEYGKQINVRIREVNDTKFIRDGFNLIVYLDITLEQVMIRDHVKMGHFNRVLDIPTRIPHSNYRHIVPGMGMPIPTSASTGGAGDLYVVYNVIFPQRINTDLALELGYGI